MTEYTPTTDDVEFAWVTMRASMGNPEVRVASTDDVSMAEFSRWLAERDRQVAERAWDEGRRAQIAHVDEWVAAQIPNSADGGYSPLVNPYRKEATGD